MAALASMTSPPGSSLPHCNVPNATQTKPAKKSNWPVRVQARKPRTNSYESVSTKAIPKPDAQTVPRRRLLAGGLEPFCGKKARQNEGPTQSTARQAGNLPVGTARYSARRHRKNQTDWH